MAAGNTSSHHDRGNIGHGKARAVDVTLDIAIQMVAEDQAEYQDLVQYFNILGETKPSNSRDWRYWVLSTRDAIPMAGLIDGTGIVRVVHSAIKFIARRGRSDTYHGHYLGAVGNLLEETDPSWVRIKHNALKWTKGRIVTNLGPTSEIAQFLTTTTTYSNSSRNLGQLEGQSNISPN